MVKTVIYSSSIMYDDNCYIQAIPIKYQEGKLDLLQNEKSYLEI